MRKKKKRLGEGVGGGQRRNEGAWKQRQTEKEAERV